MLYPVELRAVFWNTGQGLGRGGGIRTLDILLPKQARYRAALHPEVGRILTVHTFRVNYSGARTSRQLDSFSHQADLIPLNEFAACETLPFRL